MKIFYHDDLDGRCSAAIVWQQRLREGVLGETDRVFGCSYENQVSLECVAPDESVWILDFSLPVEQMRALCEITRNIVWIDHHKSAIDALRGFEWVPGLRIPTIRGTDGTITGDAGCVLTWKYAMGDRGCEAVDLVGDFDVWRWAFGERTRLFVAGMASVDTGPGARMWERLFDVDEGYAEIMRLMDRGAAVKGYQKQWYEPYMRRFGFECEFAGHRVWATNIQSVNAEAFAGIEGVDIFAAYAWNGRAWVVSLYSETVDVREIAMKAGGGGHAGAAGFTCLELPFRRPA